MLEKNGKTPWTLISISAVLLVILAGSNLFFHFRPSIRVKPSKQTYEKWAPDKKTPAAVRTIDYPQFQEYLYADIRLAINTLRGDILDLQKPATQKENNWEAFKAHIISAQNRYEKDLDMLYQVHPDSKWSDLYGETEIFMTLFASNLEELKKIAENNNPAQLKDFEEGFFQSFNDYEEKYFKMFELKNPK